MSNEGLICNALLKTNPTLYQAIDGGNTFKTAIAKRGARVAKYRRYVSGEHDASLTTQMKKMLRIKENDTAQLNDFNLNYMGIVVDKMAGRLAVKKIVNEPKTETETDPKKIDPAQEWINKLLIDNDFESIQGMFYRGAIGDGDSFVMVDPITLKWIVEPAYDGFSGMFAITRQGLDNPVWACKLYSYADLDLTSDEPPASVKMKVIVYQPNKISFFEGEASGSELTVDTNIDADTIKKAGAWNLGVPIMHFANQRDSFRQYGESEIRKGIPINDVLNRTVYSMVMASEFSAFKVAWCIGLELDKSGIEPGAVLNIALKDANGNLITELSPDQIEFLKAVRVGEFDSSDISQYTNQIEKMVVQISHVTSTPIYGVTSQGNLSGEALKQLEMGLVGKCKRFQEENTKPLRGLIEMTAKIQKAFAGFTDPPPLGRIVVEWESPELRDNVVDKETQVKKIALETAATVYTASNGAVPVETVLRMFKCFTEEEIAEIGTQRLAAIALEQEDKIPADRP